MATSEKSKVKVLFEIDGYESVEIESLWARAERDGYCLENVPFYARGFAYGDIVSAVPDADGLLRCTGLVRRSGHSTVRILCTEVDGISDLRARLKSMGCDSELDVSSLIAVDIPPEVPYSKIRAFLQEKED